MVYQGIPSPSALQARDVGLRRARGIDEGRVARVEVGEVADLIGAQEQPTQAWSGQPCTPGSKKAR
jgi:hypothetical protein